MLGFDKINGPTRAPVESEEGRKYLVFKVGGYSLALVLDVLKRVHDAEGLPPRTPDTRVVDLHFVTGAKAIRPTGYWIEMELRSGKFLMPVEEVEGIRELSLAVSIDYPEVLAGKGTRYIKRLLFDGFRMITQLDPEALVDSFVSGRPFGAARKDFSATESFDDSASAVSAGEVGVRRLLAFESGGSEYCVDLELVVQLINQDYLYSVPSTGPGIKGVAYHSDLAVPVMSGAGESKRDAETPPMIIVIETTRGLLGIACEKVLHVVTGETMGDRKTRELNPEKLIKELVLA